MPPGLIEGLLENVVRVVRIAQQLRDECVHGARPPIVEPPQRLVVPLAHALHQMWVLVPHREVRGARLAQIHP